MSILNQINVLIAHSYLYAGDGMQNLIDTGEDILKWLQRGGIVGAAIAFCIGGYFLIFGGDRGRGRAVGWFIGAAVGLVVVMGALALAKGVDQNIRFD